MRGRKLERNMARSALKGKAPTKARNLKPRTRTKLKARLKPRVDHAARRTAYLRAAAETFLAKGTFASMQDIADRAGAPKPVFYRIFPSRADLTDAFFQHVYDVIMRTQQGTWDGYGWALRVLYQEAKNDKEIFLVALNTFRGDPGFEPWRERLFTLVQQQALGLFQPAESAPPGAEERAVRASKTLSSLFFDTLIAWLENRDGLTDEARFKWWGRIIREWRKATREAFALDAG
jgi:AcrR family transcriptional regulator